MSIYQRLGEWLNNQPDSTARLKFSQIGDIIGKELGKSAKTYPAFWSTGNNAGKILRQMGWKASLDRGFREVVFRRVVPGVFKRHRTAPIEEHTTSGSPDTSVPSGANPPDLILVGCVKGKRAGRHPARDLFTSALFRGRRAVAEASGAPWFILSAKYGLVVPNELIDNYDVELKSISTASRRAWSTQALLDLKRHYGPLVGKTVEIHAGAEYRDSGLSEGLKREGATVTVPLANLTRGQQLAWYAEYNAPSVNELVPSVPTMPPAPALASGDILGITEMITRDFNNGTLDLSGRPGAPEPGWNSMPEFVMAGRLSTSGTPKAVIRAALTLVAALDRARDADQLWKLASALFVKTPWVIDPNQVTQHSLMELRERLSGAGVSQRHTIDVAAWRLIAEALVDDRSPVSIRTAILIGHGDASQILADVNATTPEGQPWYPYLSGPKVSAMWIRMLAAPGNTALKNIQAIPVAVDVQVRKVTENLGITETRGMDLESVRPIIQSAWAVGAPRAVGPDILAGTCAAIDPAVWFFGKWGCSQCEKTGRRQPVSDVCNGCHL